MPDGCPQKTVIETPDARGVTQLLIDLGKGDERALNKILPQIYDELRRLAGYYMSSERRDHTLEPTALVHEAYLRLVQSGRPRRPREYRRQ